jgi:hypothetical protein
VRRRNGRGRRWGKVRTAAAASGVASRGLAPLLVVVVAGSRAAA